MKICVSNSHFRQPVSKISLFRTSYIHKCTVEATYIIAMHPIVKVGVNFNSEISHNTNNVYFSGIRFICIRFNLAIKSILLSLGPLMTRCSLVYDQNFRGEGGGDTLCTPSPTNNFPFTHPF